MDNSGASLDRGRSARRTILIADDDEAIRTGLGRLLARKGYQVVEARDGRQAVEVFQERSCDLVLLDMNMPFLNGWGTIARLRTLNGRVPAIMITARADQRNVMREAGVELMEKPVDLPVLLERIEALLARPPGAETLFRSTPFRTPDRTTAT
jgi:DNA-binding response OmpR family regulator